jgi:hypothetical protein
MKPMFASSRLEDGSSPIDEIQGGKVMSQTLWKFGNSAQRSSMKLPQGRAMRSGFGPWTSTSCPASGQTGPLVFTWRRFKAESPGARRQ